MPLDGATFAPTTVVTDLMAGRDYIVQNGWCQHVSRDGQRACMFGGLYAVTEPRRGEAANVLQLALEAKLGFIRSGTAWNDEPGRTVEEVLEIYDFAIERELWCP